MFFRTGVNFANDFTCNSILTFDLLHIFAYGTTGWMFQYHVNFDVLVWLAHDEFILNTFNHNHLIMYILLSL